VRGRGWTLVEPCVERAGPRGERPELARALERCRELGATLVVPELAVLGRDRVFLDAVLDARVRVAALDRPCLGRGSLELLRRVAQRAHEDAAASSRSALRAARRRGVRVGSPRPEIGSRLGVAAIRARADAQAREVAPLIEEIRLSNPGIPLRGIARVLDAQRIPAPRGGRWGPSAVRNALLRAGLQTAPAHRGVGRP
jgi:DNA invertase Pin-like site-specific DNA recombinase